MRYVVRYVYSVLSEILNKINKCDHILVGVLLASSPRQKLLRMAKDLDQLKISQSPRLQQQRP